MISRRYTDEFSVIRPTVGLDSGGAEIEQAAPVVSTSMGYVEDLGAMEVAQLSALDIVAQKRLYCSPQLSILTTDRVEIESGDHVGEFEVVKVERFGGKNTHLEVLLYNAQ